MVQETGELWVLPNYFGKFIRNAFPQMFVTFALMSIIINSLHSLNLLWSLTVTSDETCLEQPIRVMSLQRVRNPSHIRHLLEVEGGRRAASCNVWPPRGPSSSPKSSLFHSTVLLPMPPGYSLHQVCAHLLEWAQAPWWNDAGGCGNSLSRGSWGTWQYLAAAVKRELPFRNQPGVMHNVC